MSERFNERPKKRELNRREFLCGAGATTGAAFALPNALNIAFSDRVHATEVKEGMTWEDGMAALRRDVFHSKTESMALYTKGAVNGWRAPRDLGVQEGSEEDMAALEQVFARIRVEEQPTLVRRAHTHPLAGLVAGGHITEHERKAILRDESTAPLAPPSVADIFLLIWTHKRWFEKDGIAFEDLVLDPSGQWRVRMRDGAFSRVLYTYQLFVREEMPRALTRIHFDSKKEQDEARECITKFDPDCVKKYPEIAALRSTHQNLNTALYPMLPLLDGYAILGGTMRDESMKWSTEKRTEEIKKNIEFAANINIDLIFTPYDKKTES